MDSNVMPVRLMMDMSIQKRCKNCEEVMVLDYNQAAKINEYVV